MKMKNTLLQAGHCLSIDCLEICSLSYLALVLLEDKHSDILFYTSQNYLLVKSELSHLKIHSKFFNDYQERVDFNFLKNTLTEAKEDFFTKFEKKVQAFKGKIIYFDRIDYFLDCPSLKAYDKSLSTLNSIVKKYDKQILYIYNSKSTKSTTLDKAIKKNTTILDFSNYEKEQTMPSLQTQQKELLAELSQPKETISLSSQSDMKIQVMLMSDSHELKKLHYYIFTSTDDVDYYTIDNLPEEEMEIIDEMDIIIYNKKDDTLKKQLLQQIKDHKLNVKFFEITNSDYLRQKDLLHASIEGVDKLFKKDFLMEDYIISIEMYLKSNFYSKRLLALDDSAALIIPKKELFDSRIEELLEKKIFFSLLRYHYDADADINSYNVQKIVREYDNIYLNKRKNEITFIILNTLPDFAHALIQKRIRNFSITLEKKKVESSFDLIFD